MNKFNSEDKIEFIAKVNGETVSISAEELSHLLQKQKQIFNRYIDVPNNFEGVCTIIDRAATYYYKKGRKLHREGGPAIECENGTKYWYIDDKLHRLDGPAVEYSDGLKYWYKDNKRHRADGPAIEHMNGDKEWFLNGKCHRTDGPAVEYANGYKEWWLNGRMFFTQFTNETWKEFIKGLNHEV